MSQFVSPLPFFSADQINRWAEYAAAFGRLGDRVVTSMIAQRPGFGSIQRIALGVFASATKHADAAELSVDSLLAASLLRQCIKFVYRSVGELQGYACPEGHDLQVIREGEPCLLD
ncbi:MAG: hypothetical protein OXI87_17225 [Albidovulum sp.]|nr:hypothetical protein [Albidovulum sp.]MDE0530520.1 hypothetical protein [Albidovulum sp.]